MKTNKLTIAKVLPIALIAGVTTGMGNGSVFGAAMMCFLGRGPFDQWGGWMGESYNLVTFNGFMTWCMLVFGIMYVVIMLLALRRHDALEQSKA